MAEFDVKCADCNAQLDAIFNGYSAILEVTPCQNCLDKANNEGYESGLEEGKDGY